MTDNISDIRDFYATQVENEDNRLERHQLERDLTRRYLLEHLPPPPVALLEIGAATGAYTLWLAQQGYTVCAVDLTAELLEANRQRLERAGLAERVTYCVADARTLEGVPPGPYAAALLMGPLYHLVYLPDRQAAVQQAVQRLQPGGVMVASFISRLGIMGDLLRKMPQWIEETAEVRSILDIGRDPDHWPPGGFRGYFATAEEISPLFEGEGLRTLVLAGVEPCISADDEAYNILEGERRQRWQDLFYEVGRQPTQLAASRHLLYMGKV